MNQLALERYIAEKDRRRAANLRVTGNTFQYKTCIAQLGGVWDKIDKCWLMPDQQAMAAVKEATRAISTADGLMIPYPKKSGERHGQKHTRSTARQSR